VCSVSIDETKNLVSRGKSFEEFWGGVARKRCALACGWLSFYIKLMNFYTKLLCVVP